MPEQMSHYDKCDVLGNNGRKEAVKHKKGYSILIKDESLYCAHIGTSIFHRGFQKVSKLNHMALVLGKLWRSIVLCPEYKDERFYCIVPVHYERFDHKC